MDVKVYQAKLVVEEKEVPLTAKVARQFPIRYDRVEMAYRKEALPKPICKVQATTIDKHATDRWFVLVEDDVAGLVWQEAVVPHTEAARRIFREKGLQWDSLEDIPTVIL